MDISLEKPYEFPYFWTSNSKEIIFDTLTEKGFKHVHLEGNAGVGKSRCIFEIQTHLNCCENVLSVNYSSDHDIKNQETILNIISKAIFKKLSLDINENNVCDALEAESLSKHVVIAIEDLHYQDDIRDSLINKMIYQCEETNCNITLITTSRKKFHLMKSNTYQTIKLDNLSSNDASSLINYGCKHNATLKMLRKNLLTVSNGNPLYISEAMNIVIQAHKDPFLNLNPSEFFKLNDIDDLYKMLLSTFNDAQQEILRAASTIGKTFYLDDLLYLLPYYKNYLVDILEELSKKKFLTRQKDGLKYSFVHDKQLENIYKNIDLNEKHSWHIALFQKYKKSRNYELCGRHLYHAHKYQDAIPYLTHTARRSLKNAQPKKAEMYFLKAFYAMEKSGLAFNKSYLKLKIDYCQSLVMQGDANKLRPIIHEIKTDKTLATQASFIRIEIPYKWISNEYDKNYILDTWDYLQNDSNVTTEKFRLLGMLIDIGEYKEAESKINLSFETIMSEKNIAFIPANIILQSFLSNIYAQTGDLKNMQSSIDRCLKNIEEMHNPTHKIYGLAFCAKALQTVGLYEDATPLIEEAYAINQDSKIGIITPDILSIYADNLMNKNDLFKACFLLDNLMDIIEENGIEANKSLHLSHQAYAYYKFGVTRLPVELLLSAINTAEKQGNRYQESYASYTLAKIYFETGDFEQGELYSEHAKRISENIEAKSLSNSIDLLVRKHVIGRDTKASK